MTAPLDEIVIIGGSLAGATAVKTLREQGYRHSIVVVDAERHDPYDRYPLSKAFLNGASGFDDIALPVADATWVRGRRAVGLDVGARVVTLDDGRELPFDGLVVATGARPRTVDAAPLRLSGVFVLRTVDDGIALRAALKSGPDKLVIVGAGMIGAEIATTAASLGIETTMVDSSSLPLARTLGADVARSVGAMHDRNGVRVLAGRRVQRIAGRHGVVTGVELADGGLLPADVVVVALGTVVNTEWLAGSGLALDDGLVCAGTLHASESPPVLGAGDVARWEHPYVGPEPIRVETWSNALAQAAMAAKNLLRGRAGSERFCEAPTFNSRIHGVHVRVTGFPRLATDSRFLFGHAHDEAYVMGFERDGVLIGLVAFNAAARLEALRHRLGYHAQREASRCLGGNFANCLTEHLKRL